MSQEIKRVNAINKHFADNYNKRTNEANVETESIDVFIDNADDAMPGLSPNSENDFLEKEYGNNVIMPRTKSSVGRNIKKMLGVNTTYDLYRIGNDGHIVMPNVQRKDGYTPQGICTANGYKVVTAYKEGENSKIYILSRSGTIVQEIELNNKNHCGGVSYDEKSGMLYVTGSSGKKATVEAYNFNSLLNGYNEPVSEVTVSNNKDMTTSVNNRTQSAAYLTVSDGKLYVGNFADRRHQGIIKSYDINADGSIDKSSERIMKNPYSETQGMCIMHKNGKDYYVFSSSHGRNNNSTIYTAEMKNGKLVPVSEYKLPCMAEQISMNSEGNVDIIFESCSDTYSDSADNVQNTIDTIKSDNLISQK